MLDKFVGHEKEIRANRIISVQINLLNSCPSRCKSCRKYTWPDFKWDVNELKNVIKNLKEKFGLQTIFFCGGDPILYKDFPELIDFLCEQEIQYSLITTLLTTNYSLLEKISKTAYRIHVSVDAVDKELYKEIRGVNGFDLMRKNLKYINEIKGKNELPIIRFSSTIGTLNCKSVIDIYNFAKENNALLRYNLLRIWDGISMSKEDENYFYNQLKLIIDDERNNKKQITNANFLLLGDLCKCEIEKCRLPFVSCVIDANGDLYPCCWIMEEFDYYDKQKERSYGNVAGNKSSYEIIKEFNKRLFLKYPQNNGLCEDCMKYYGNVLKDLEVICEKKKSVLFF